jgi:quinol monooxygenase YgiN
MITSNIRTVVQKGRISMYARVFLVNTEPTKRDDLVQVIRESVLPAAQQQQGFKGYLALSDPSTGKGIAISLWETEADLKASEATAQGLAAKVAPLFTSVPVREVYEVLVQV